VYDDNDDDDGDDDEDDEEEIKGSSDGVSADDVVGKAEPAAAAERCIIFAVDMKPIDVSAPFSCAVATYDDPAAPGAMVVGDTSLGGAGGVTQ